MTDPKHKAGDFVMAGSQERHEVKQVYQHGGGTDQHRYAIENCRTGRVTTVSEDVLEAASAPPEDDSLRGKHRRETHELRTQLNEAQTKAGELNDKCDKLTADLADANDAMDSMRKSHEEELEALRTADKTTPTVNVEPILSELVQTVESVNIDDAALGTELGDAVLALAATSEADEVNSTTGVEMTEEGKVAVRKAISDKLAERPMFGKLGDETVQLLRLSLNKHLNGNS